MLRHAAQVWAGFGLAEYGSLASRLQISHRLCSLSSDLLKLLVFYVRSNRLKSPRVSDAMSQLKLGRKTVHHIYGALLSQEAAAGRKLCDQQQHLFGHLEGDAHTIRKVYISKTNPEFQDEVQDALRRWKAQKPG